MNNREKLQNIALKLFRASEHDETRFSYLCGNDVKTFGFFLREWLDDYDPNITDKELAELARSCEYGIAWIVPVEVAKKIEGYALFTGHAGAAAEDEPMFMDVFNTIEEAKEYLRLDGVIADNK